VHHVVHHQIPYKQKALALCACPRDECREYYLVEFKLHSNGMEYAFVRFLGGEVSIPPFDPRIENLSAQFITIFKEAATAESVGLFTLCGAGYRKALEFLIKDYLKSKRPEDSEVIEKSMLGNCINSYIDDQRIKEVAARAAWLGNDEVHYVKKWLDKDLQDLKRLIDITVHWIVMEIMTAEAIEQMPAK
jgi:hypothetical protein